MNLVGYFLTVTFSREFSIPLKIFSLKDVDIDQSPSGVLLVFKSQPPSS